MESFFRFNRGVMLGGKILVGAIMTGATFLLFINVILRYAFESGIARAVCSMGAGTESDKSEDYRCITFS